MLYAGEISNRSQKLNRQIKIEFLEYITQILSPCPSQIFSLNSVSKHRAVFKPPSLALSVLRYLGILIPLLGFLQSAPLTTVLTKKSFWNNADNYTYQRIGTVSLLTATAFREVKMIGTTILT